MKYVLAVDPGKATGMAFFTMEKGQEPVMVWSGEFQQDEYAAPIRKELANAQDGGYSVDIVCERFTINAQTVRNSQAPFSLEQIGVLKQCMMDAGMAADDINFQSPANAKAMFTNEKLKKIGYWHKGGEGHALDAIRHGLLHLVSNGWKPLSLLN
jgi:hypothetical protein